MKEGRKGRPEGAIGVEKADLSHEQLCIMGA